jgi:hypothetical protein
VSGEEIAVSTAITPVEPEAATGQAAELLNRTKAALGLVPNMAKVMATSPALLRLSKAIAENVGDVAEADIAAARAARVTNEEIGEVVANPALNTLMNYFNVLVGVQNDWPAVQL